VATLLDVPQLKRFTAIDPPTFRADVQAFTARQ